MGLNIKAWNLGGLVGLVTGCSDIAVPAGEGDAPTSTDPQDGDEDPSSPEGPLDPQCESDDDCDLGQECRDGVCEYAPYCSTCCEDDCDPDTGAYPECYEDADCPEGDDCFAGMCVTGGDLPECGEPAFDVQPLPIPGADFGTNLVFVRDAGAGLDRLVVAEETRVAVVSPDGSAVWHEAAVALGLPRPISVGDFDGDGDDEVMLTGTTGTIDDPSSIAVYEVDSGAPELVGVTVAPVYSGYDPVVGDFDGDGDDDVLTNVGEFGQSIFAAQGDGTFAPPVALDLFELVLAADVDGDGRDEITTQGGVVMDVADGFVLETRFELTTMQPSIGIFSLLADDFDDDGTRELLVVSGGLQTSLEHNDTNGALVSAFAVPEGFGPAESAVLGGTSALDLALRAAVVFDPTGSPCVQSYAEPDGVQRAAAGDWDGDGRDEIVFKHEFTYDFAWARLPASR
jgi:hypothetical protein